MMGRTCLGVALTDLSHEVLTKCDDRIASPILKHPPSQNATVDRHTPSALFQHFEPANLAGSNL